MTLLGVIGTGLSILLGLLGLIKLIYQNNSKATELQTEELKATNQATEARDAVPDPARADVIARLRNDDF